MPELSRLPESEVTVWGTLSLLTQVTRVPGLIVMVAGLNTKFLMFTVTLLEVGVSTAEVELVGVGVGIRVSLSAVR